MTQLTTTPEGFRTAAYLAARARLDAARTRSRSGKTSRSVSCNPPNVRCGGRCIPPSWDCRLKGEGPDPQLRAVKTDPLSGFANIQRGIGRITKGVTRGNLSEVQGGRAAIIRGVVKTVPGDIQQKKQLKATLENRTRAIGLGLAVVTTGLGMHALLMKSNLYGYRQGWGKDINQATRAGVSRVLDSIPVLGGQRRATEAGVKAGVAAATARASAPAMSNSAIPGTTVLSATNRESQSDLQKSLKAVNLAARSASGTSGNLENWNQRHKEAFWSADRSHDLSLKDAKGQSIARISIYAEPTAQEYLGKQFGVPAGERTSRSGIKAAMQSRLSEERSGLVSLAKQQGFRTIRTSSGDRINPDDVNLFVRGVMRNNPIAETAVRQRVEEHVRSVLKDAPSTYTDKLYNASVVSFDTFYKETSAGLANIPGAAATGRRSVEPLTAGSNELLRNTNIYRSTYLAGEMRARTQMAGPAHAELVQTAYYHTRVVGTNASPYTITDRLTLNAASELSGRSITSRSEAIGIINRETGFSGARIATTAAPRTVAPSTTGQSRPATRRLRSRSELISRLTKGGLSPEAAAAEADRIIARRGDSADLPPRVAAYLQMRSDFVAGKKGLGKPCGESHIPKAHECRKGAGSAPAKATPESGATSDRLRAAATGALVAGLAAGGAAAFRNRQSLAMGAIRGLSAEKVQAGLAKVPSRFQEPVRNLVGRTKTAVAGVLMVSKGSKLIDVDNENNMATFSLRNGDLVSVSNVGDALVMFRTHPNNTIDYGGGETAGRYVVDFTVDLLHKQSKQERKQALGIARKTKTMFGKQMSYIPDNSFVTAESYGTDGLGNKRGSIYQKYGFQPIGDVSTHLWGIKAKGEFRKMNQRQINSLISVLREQKRVDTRKHLADLPPRVAAYLQMQSRTDAAGEKGLGKPCGASHIPKTYKCSKGAAGSTSDNRKRAAIIAAVVGGTVAIGVAGAVAYNVKTISDPSKTPLTPSPNIRDVIKAAKAEAGTKSASEAMGHYYVNKSGLKPGDVVYFRTAKDPSAHFGVYLGPGKDGIVRAVIANTKASRFSWTDVAEIGSVKPGVKTAQAVMTPLVKAPTPQFLQGGKGPYTPEEVVRRAIRISDTDYKFSVTRNNCETLANTIAYGVPKSEQLDRFNRVSKTMVDFTVGRGQRREGERAIFEGRAQGRNYTAADFYKFLEGERAFSSPEGKNLARQYDSYFKGYNLDAQNAPNYLGLISPSELWSSIKTYEAPVRAQAMSNYLFALRTLKEMAQS